MAVTRSSLSCFQSGSDVLCLWKISTIVALRSRRLIRGVGDLFFRHGSLSFCWLDSPATNNLGDFIDLGLGIGQPLDGQVLAGVDVPLVHLMLQVAQRLRQFDEGLAPVPLLHRVEILWKAPDVAFLSARLDRELIVDRGLTVRDGQVLPAYLDHLLSFYGVPTVNNNLVPDINLGRHHTLLAPTLDLLPVRLGGGPHDFIEPPTDVVRVVHGLRSSA
jgi:hypothetical protein